MITGDSSNNSLKLINFFKLNKYKLKIKILLLITFSLIIFSAIYYFKTPIGRDLSHSYWPKVALEKKTLSILGPYLYKSSFNFFKYLIT